MKNKFIITFLTVAAALFVFSARAQTSIPCKVYPLTNSTAFTVAGGGTNLATTATATINSQPFQIWRGRGFTFNTSFTPGSSSVSNETFVIQFATPVNTPTGWQTNWSTSGNQLSIAAPCNGTAKVYFSTNISPNVADNVQLGRLATAQNAALSTTAIDATNTYITVYP